MGLVVIWEIDLILGFGDFLSTLLLGLVQYGFVTLGLPLVVLRVWFRGLW